MVTSPKTSAVATRFATEIELVRAFVLLLSGKTSPWGHMQLTTEWDYRSGFTDVLARTQRQQIVAFEAKLTDWRRASHQAYKNTMFAEKAYVVMPMSAAERAQQQTMLFEDYGVGLCAVSSSCVKILIEARQNEPLLPWLRRRAHSHFDGEPGDCRTGAFARGRNNLQPAECVV